MSAIAVQAQRRFGEFVLERELGRGATGVVYLARQERLDRHVALKVLAPHCARDPAWRERFIAGARAQASVHHAALCPVLEVGAVDDTPYLVMPHLAGATLAEQVARRREQGRVPDAREVARLLSVFEDAAAGLARLHDAGLVHADVKPGNLLATPDGRGIVLDLGVAQARADRTTHLLAGAGTPAYLAPERIAGSAGAAAADVYALAVALYECLTLELPFAAPSRDALYRAILQDAPPPARARNPAVPRALDVVLAAAMEKDPARRVASATALGEDLRRVRLGLPILARRLPLDLRCGRFVRRHPLPSALLALLLLSLPLLVGATVVADRARQAADAQALRARATLDPVDLLARRVELRAARAAPAVAVPPWPEHLAALQRWTTDSLPLLPLRQQVEQARQRVRAGTALASAVDGDAGVDAWLADALAEFGDDLARFERGLWRHVQHRLTWATRCAQLESGPLAALWRRAIDEVRASPHYGGLTIAPQPGLIPLGPDPDTGLHEFYDPAAAGDGPMLLLRDAHGRLLGHIEQGLVFVLLPGGPTRIGAQRHDPLAPYYDDDQACEALQDVRLAPFLLSKFELTRWQWGVLSGGEDPSALTHASIGYRRGDPEILRHPVQQVSALECDALLARIGAELPTAAQWEYACRAGTTTVHYAGGSPAELEGYENVQARPDLDLGPAAPVDVFDDGWRATAPVGAFHANPFGLHDMLGNVTEWCRDLSASAAIGAKARDGDGQRDPPGAWQRAVRGGAFGTRVREMGSARGLEWPPEVKRVDVGLRPARRLF